jgi:hypothetical protein
MSNRFASGKHALGLFDVCGAAFKLKTLKPVIRKGNRTGLLACRKCWDPDHPQLKLGQFPVYDPQALRNPRPDSIELDQVRQLYDIHGNPTDQPLDISQVQL